MTPIRFLPSLPPSPSALRTTTHGRTDGEGSLWRGRGRGAANWRRPRPPAPARPSARHKSITPWHRTADADGGREREAVMMPSVTAKGQICSCFLSVVPASGNPIDRRSLRSFHFFPAKKRCQGVNLPSNDQSGTLIVGKERDAGAGGKAEIGGRTCLHKS